MSCHGGPPSLHSFPTRRSSDLQGGREQAEQGAGGEPAQGQEEPAADGGRGGRAESPAEQAVMAGVEPDDVEGDRKSTRLNSSHPSISYAVFCLKKKICRSCPSC